MVKVRPTGEALVCQRADIVDSNGQADKIITINIAGERFQTLDSTLKRFPNSLLGSEKKREKYFNKTRQEYFFDRHRQSFGAILYIYQSQGHVLRPENVPIFHFLNELKFYEFGPEVMSSFWENEGYQESPEQPVPKNKIQRHIWNLFESPESSIVARFIGFFSIFMITLSCIAFILETLPDFEDVNKSKLYSSPFYIIELVCSVWFLIEFTLRFLSSPSKLIFLKSFGNIMDFVAILPFYISFFWTLLSDGQSDASFGVLRIVRLIRVIQVFKLSRHSIGLRVLGQTLKASLQEIILMGFFLLIALILFSSGMYFSETDTDSKFTSIPASFWFTLATITTVGFGDLVPVTPFGKIIGSLCALLGVLTLTFPVSIIITNFKQYYRQAYRLASLNDEDLKKAAADMKSWRLEELQSGNRNEATETNDDQQQRPRQPELFRKGVAPLHWLQTQGSMSSADDALYM